MGKCDYRDEEWRKEHERWLRNGRDSDINGAKAAATASEDGVEVLKGTGSIGVRAS